MTNEESFLKLLDDMRNSSQSKREQGTKFEKLMQKVFRTSPLYAEMYDKVWLWSEFPYADTNDIGIDIVVKKRDKDEYTAIQCKFYDDNNPISKGDVDTFLSASGKALYIGDKEYRYSERIIVSTNDKWSSNAESTIVGQLPPVTRIRIQDLQECGINWNSFTLDNIASMQKSPKKMPRPHQIEAIQAVIDGLKTANRGKLIMACGTGKTFTSLKIAENQTHGTGNVLFLVPSISLLNQTLLEWSAQCSYEYRVFAVCSDPKASKDTDSMDSLTDTLIPATTNVSTLMREYKSEKNKNVLNLFFSTYQSISVIHEFQKQSGIEFDLTICDEAHRTTGVIDKKESEFVRVHDEKYIKTAKRLYMTATPRVYGDSSKKKADENSVVLCSMDDISLYGEEFYRLGFAQAVKLGLLSDYKVIVLAVDEEYAVRTCQKQITDKKSELTLDDSVKIIGCLNGLSKKTIFSGDESYFANDPLPMKTAVAFSSKIADSKQFVKLVQEVQSNLQDDSLIHAELQHVDGKQNATERKHHIEWLKESTTEGTCRILSNARCLSEGIDVPALDAVIFLNPRKSMVDIIQSVGRVMRKAEGKQYGYIILPIGIPAGVAPEEALNKDTQKYKVVWEVLQALRSHDDRFNDTINKIDLNKKKPKQINIIGVGNGDNDSDNSGSETDSNGEQIAFALDFGKLSEWKDEIYAKIVKKCGSRQYWELWAKDIAEIATRHIQEINILLENPEIAEKFAVFLKALQMNLNSSIQQSDAVEMLAEHMITKPVFDALFEGYEFVKHNPVSQMMEEMLAVLNEKALDKEQETLDKFYASVRERAKGIDNADGKQRIIIELYEQFFKNALPKQVQKLGIVYTPVEVVDFIIKSVDTVLKKCFNKSLNSRDVHILDPFTGTGTFIVRLLRSGLIDIENLLYKYTNEIHANEIVLLAYYIATINIEETFHDLIGAEEYTPFNGIVLTDTFAMTEKQYSQATEGVDSFVSDMFAENSARAEKQLSNPITVIIGNPPYSMGQKSINDNNQNTYYLNLDSRITESYGNKSTATTTRAVYDSYVKAFRWSADRIGDNGIIGFVSNGSYLDSVAMDGFRQCLLEDFTHVYVFNLRGNARTQGEQRRKEKGNVFGEGTRTPVAITILIKRSGVPNDGFIRYHDIGDYLTREEKLNIIAEFGDIDSIKWEHITPNENNDWINQRNQDFSKHIILGDKKTPDSLSIFSDNYAMGFRTDRDAWLYGFNPETAKSHASSMISVYNSERTKCFTEVEKRKKDGTLQADRKSICEFLASFRNNDPTKISWTDRLVGAFNNNEEIQFSDETRLVLYRPFCKRYCSYNKRLIERISKWENIYPDSKYKNLAICISGAGGKKGFSVIMSDCIEERNLLASSQAFPLYFYEKRKETDSQLSLFADETDTQPKYTRLDAITDEALQAFRKVYGEEVTKEDIFYYIYAVLQSKGYISAYQDNLSKEMPRIPFLKGFAEYVRIGKALADVHLHYEQPVNPSEIGLTIEIDKEDYTVKQMKFPKDGKKALKDTIIFNEYIRISSIPKRVYDYIINGKSAVEWVMERYAITTDKASGITDNPNDYGDEKYIFNLLISVMSVSLKTLELIDSMPEYEEI